MKNLKDGLTSVDVTYYAHWTALPTCTIAFDPAGGELEMTSLQVLQGGVVGELPTPRYTGYHFVGWFTAGGAPFTAECSMSADITLHARWERLPLVSGGGADWFVRADGVWQSGAVGNMSEHTIRWAYTKDYSVSSYSDCGWIKDFLVSGLSFDGAGFLVAGGRLLAYNGEGGDIEIPAGVTSIDEDVFSENETITSVVFPDTLKSIGDGAFYGCSGIEDVTIPASVTDLGYHAFGYCTSLRAVRFLGNKPAIVTSKYGSGCYEGTPDSLTSFVRRDRLESWASDASDALPLSWGKRAIAFWDYTPVTRAVPVAVGHAWLAERWEALRTKYASLAPAIWRDMSEVPEDDRKKYRFFKGVMEMR